MPVFIIRFISCIFAEEKKGKGSIQPFIKRLRTQCVWYKKEQG
jgi:hypothetical protein